MSGIIGHRGLLLASGATDPHAGNVVSLMHFDGANNSTTFTDRTGRVWTRTGNAVISTTQSRFGGASLSTGSTGYLSTPLDASLRLGAGDFTVEAWVRPSNNTTYMNIFSSRNSWGLTFRMTDSGKLECFYGGGVQSTVDSLAGALPTNAFTHVALARQGSTWRLFRGGQLAATNPSLGSASVDSDDETVAFIGTYSGVYERWAGFIDEFRLTKGVARYTANFTPPATAFPDP